MPHLVLAAPKRIRLFSFMVMAFAFKAGVYSSPDWSALKPDGCFVFSQLTGLHCRRHFSKPLLTN